MSDYIKERWLVSRMLIVKNVSGLVNCALWYRVQGERQAIKRVLEGSFALTHEVEDG
jgi:hypothetical protein